MSVLMHVGLLFGMSTLPDSKSLASTRVVELEVRKPPPPPPPPPEPEKVEPPPPPPPPTVKPKLVKKLTVEKVIPDEPKPPPEPVKPKMPPQGFSVDMSSTVNAGGVAVPAI